MDSNGIDGLLALRQQLRNFAEDRDWDQFHSPKNLAIALSVEASELLELFQWLPEHESTTFAAEKLEKVREEMADVLLYLVRLADKLNVDLLQASFQKLDINAKKYPVELARGNSTKYTDR